MGVGKLRMLGRVLNQTGDFHVKCLLILRISTGDADTLFYFNRLLGLSVLRHCQIPWSKFLLPVNQDIICVVLWPDLIGATIVEADWRPAQYLAYPAKAGAPLRVAQ